MRFLERPVSAEVLIRISNRNWNSYNRSRKSALSGSWVATWRRIALYILWQLIGGLMLTHKSSCSENVLDIGHHFATSPQDATIGRVLPDSQHTGKYIICIGRGLQNGQIQKLR